MPASAFTGNKPRLSLTEIINMSVGFFGIQFGWDLQRANMGVIYDNLGADPDKIPYLFLAAPLTGLVVQPIIGYLSDKTWHPKWGRRRPYFFIGALLSSIALIFMPHSGTLWVAAGLLWVLDVFGNVAMEPFRAFVADKLPDSQVNRGFIMQSLMIGLGGSIASALPWIFKNIFKVDNIAPKGFIADNVKYSFYIGSFFFLASVLYTVFSTKEYPPSGLGLKEKNQEPRKGFGRGISEILSSMKNMPSKMRVIALVQFFTWPGLFLMWFYYSLSVAYHVFGAKNNTDPLFGEGKDFAGLTLAYYSVVTFVFSFILPSIADKLGRKLTHSICLLFGAVGLISVSWVNNKYLLFGCMTGVGIAWTSILSMPYAMLSKVLPKDKIGIYMGIFNFFIVLPEIIASLGYPWIMNHLLNNDMIAAVKSGGILMIIASVICFFFIREDKDEVIDEELAVELELSAQRNV
ncbi:MAG: MFS transporter [Bacteroidetes bacterium]|nr:MFS transporter [Bacteroidota bacterium]MBS1973760.1 MFS transporter [Bacteroidota bacterium]